MRWWISASVAVVLSVEVAGAQAPAQGSEDALLAAARAIDQADFEGALSQLERARRSAEVLDRSGSLRWLELRMMVDHALQPGEVSDAARTLAAVAPDHVFAREVAPSLRALWAQARSETSAVDLSAAPAWGLGRVYVVPRVTPASLPYTELRLFARVDGGSYVQADGALELTAPDGARVLECFVELVGPGGAPLATNGTRSRPLRFERGTEAATTRLPPERARSPHDDTVLHAVLVIAAVAVVGAGAATIAIVATQPSDSRLIGPTEGLELRW